VLNDGIVLHPVGSGVPNMRRASSHEFMAGSEWHADLGDRWDDNDVDDATLQAALQYEARIHVDAVESTSDGSDAQLGENSNAVMSDRHENLEPAAAGSRTVG